MKPSILVLAASPSAAVMAQLDAQFDCHHLWQVDADARDAFIDGVAAHVRAVVSTGALGIDASLVARLPKLEIVAVNGIGVDAVDFDAIRVRSGDWERRAPLAPGRAVRGKTAGIFGFGRIGQAIALRLQAFGMTVRYYQPRAIATTDVPRADSLQALAADSDVLIVSAPGGPATRHAVDAAVLRALGPQGVLVNVARGSLVDEAALVAALSNGELGGAALDVFAHEPAVPAALLAMDNVVLTPHVGSLTVETRHAMGQLVVDNLLAHFAGRALLTPVA